MKKLNETLKIGELLEKTAFHGLKNRKANNVIKHSTIFSFWNMIVGAKFANFTRPYSIKNSKLYVSVKSPVIVQELTLYKSKLINKINSYSKPLGIEIDDMIFNYKNYSMQNPIKSSVTADQPIELDKNKLDNITVDPDIEDHIKKNVDKIKFLNNEQKEKFASKILSTYQAKALQDS